MIVYVRRIVLRLRLSLFTSTRIYLAVAETSRNLIRLYGDGATAEARQRRDEARGRDRLFWAFVETDLELRGLAPGQARAAAAGE